jgi:hypothetical protein
MFQYRQAVKRDRVGVKRDRTNFGSRLEHWRTIMALQLVPVDDKNGGTTAWGRFEQTKEDVTCFIKLPEGTRAKMLKVNITSTTVSASLAKGNALMHGTLVAGILADDSYWEINDGTLELHLVKERRAKACGRENIEGWWPCVLHTDSVLDVRLCDKEPFLLGEMDDLQQNSMRSMIARMVGSDDPTDGRAPTLDPLID